MSDASENNANKTILVKLPNTDSVVLVMALVLDPAELNVEKMLAGLVPEMAQGKVRGGLLVVGDSTLVLRLTDEEVLVDEVNTEELLSLGDQQLSPEPDREKLVGAFLRWISHLEENWRDRVVGRLREVLVPHIVAGLRGEVEVVDGIWGEDAHRVAETV